MGLAIKKKKTDYQKMIITKVMRLDKLMILERTEY